MQELDVENTAYYHREHFPVVDRSAAKTRTKMSDVMSRATDPEASVPYDDFPTDNLSVYPWMKGRTPSEVLKE